MSNVLRVLLIIFSVCLLSLILNYMSKNKLPIRYALFWLVAPVIIFIVGAFPDFAVFFTKIIGFETTSNLVIGVILAMLLFITLMLTMIVSDQKRKIKLLIQEVSLMKQELEDKN